jgi:hypothetical protein
MKKTLRQKILPLFVGAIFICAFASSAGAIPLTYTDSGITYTLNINDDANADGTRTATFSISMGDSNSGSTPPDLRVGWVSFRLSPHGGKISSVSPEEGAAGNWAPGVDGGDYEEVPWGGNSNNQNIQPFHGSWTRFYSAEIVSSSGEPAGLLLNPGTSYSWTINIDGEVDFSEDEMPFRVGFFSESAGNSPGWAIIGGYKNNPPGPPWPPGEPCPPGPPWLPGNPGKPVPEPATLLLVGSGLLLIGLWGRRKFKMVR